MKRTFVAVLSAASLITTGAYAEEKEPLAVFEIGAASNWTTPNSSSAGPTVAVEFTPIKDWLEIEIGTGPLFASGTTDWSTDILFKKPFDLSNTTELMVGAGPRSILHLAAQQKPGSSSHSISCFGRGQIASMAGS